jgi:flagellar biosynthesis GTPase FlhF
MHTEIGIQEKQSSSKRLKGVRPLEEKSATKQKQKEQLQKEQLQKEQLQDDRHQEELEQDDLHQEELEQDDLHQEELEQKNRQQKNRQQVELEKKEQHQEKLEDSLQEGQLQEKQIKKSRKPVKSSKETQLLDSRQFHKTKLLLSIYRTVVWRIEGAINEVQEKANEYGSGRITELIDFLSLELDEYDLKRDRKAIEDRLMCIAQTKHMIEIVDKALKHLKNHPINGQLYHDIITHCYIKEEIMSNEAIILKLNLTSSTFYRHKKEATKLMGIALWGYIIPPLRDFWDGFH